MKSLLLSLCMAFSVFASCDLPLDKIDFKNPNPKSLEDYLYDRIDGLDDLIVEIEHKTVHYDHETIYNVGYYFGKRRALHEVLDHIQGKTIQTIVDSLEQSK